MGTFINKTFDKFKDETILKMREFVELNYLNEFRVRHVSSPNQSFTAVDIRGWHAEKLILHINDIKNIELKACSYQDDQSDPDAWAYCIISKQIFEEICKAKTIEYQVIDDEGRSREGNFIEMQPYFRMIYNLAYDSTAYTKEIEEGEKNLATLKQLYESSKSKEESLKSYRLLRRIFFIPILIVLILIPIYTRSWVAGIFPIIYLIVGGLIISPILDKAIEKNEKRKENAEWRLSREYK